MKGNLKSNRVCVYLSSAGADKTRKLLGVPEVKDGTGKAESEAVKGRLEAWKVRKTCVCGLVFDTTSSNSGAESGPCRLAL